ncbi:MAG TPA: tripartite tricarboxylate transporter substrate binding protein [Burkholderiales bacterium]|nr:tripartite tricarboxylate transporter substrate binding protein [Burkholderiales bacterium]
MRFFFLTLLCIAVPLCAVAQTYPAKPVRMISPFPPGGGTDAVARLVAQALSDQLGQQVVVDSRGGANGIIGTELAARSAADGYTLLLGNSAPLAILPHLTQKLPYDPVKDFSPISLGALSDFVLVVHPSVPVKNVKELIALAKVKPGQLNYAAGGTGTPSHLAMELFSLLAEVKLVQVPYKGNGPASIGLMTGECSVMIGSGPAVLPHHKAGKVRALATTGLKRSILDLPAIAEFLPGYEVVQWYGVLAPAGTPKEIVDRLHAEIAHTIANPKLAQLLTNMGLVPTSNTPDEFRALIRLEIEKWGKVIKAAGIKGE